jgi:choline dehydrogenase-like flavoprotein
MSEEADVCVVGGGAGGAVAAWALARRGARVTLLETGPRIRPSDFSTHGQDFELWPSPLARTAAAPEHESYESAPGEPLDPRFAHLASASFTAHAAPPPRARRSFYWSRAVGLGGSTLHYQGEAHRFPAHAFRMRSRYGVGADWPIAHEELAPWYERVEALLDVCGDPDNPFKPARGPYPHPAHPLSAPSRRLARGAATLGWQLLPNSLAILPIARPDRAPCHYCNGCERGCDVAAKSSVDVAVLPEAEATGRLRIETGFRVTRLEHGPDGRIVAAIGLGAGGGEERRAARAFVLAAGAVETPRLLLHSAGGAHPRGVGNAHDQVGRYLMETLFVNRYALFDEPLSTWIGVPIDARIWDGNGATGSPESPAGFVLGQVCGPFQGPLGHALEGAPGFGASHRRAMRKGFGSGIVLLGIAEQVPRAENRVTLSQRTDARGVPLARVETRLDATDLGALSAMHERLGALADASGARRVGQVTAYDTPMASHVAGTCRMGDDPAASVVDRRGRVHGARNLAVADASVLVTEGAGDSPSLTIQALALRAAEALFDDARRGEI